MPFLAEMDRPQLPLGKLEAVLPAALLALLEAAAALLQHRHPRR
jgi:hypothetical protein